MACCITTVDNPYNPIDDFEHWYHYDVIKGYNTCSYLARVCHTSQMFTDKENEDEIERAIDEIIFYNPLFYKKVKE